MLKRVFDTDGTIVSEEEVGADVAVPKSVYKKSEFIALLAPAKIRAIQAAAETNDVINTWVFNMHMKSDDVDLNNLEPWFEAGLDEFARIDPVIYKQAVIDAFLER